MANNVVSIDAYQVNQRVIPLPATKIGLPTQSTFLGDCSNSPTCLLSSGASVYSFGIVPNGDKYYFHQTYTELVALFNA